MNGDDNDDGDSHSIVMSVSDGAGKASGPGAGSGMAPSALSALAATVRGSLW